MYLSRLLVIGVLGVGTAGCSIRPLPEDVTGYDTVQIVSKVRCEVRDALRSYVIGAFSRPERVSRYSALVATLEDPSFDWSQLRSEFKRHNVDPGTLAVFERYNGGAIAYEFSLDIKEKNANAANVDFLSTLTNGNINLGLHASSDLLRGNKRTFRSVDNFEFLTTIVPERYCAPSSDFPIHTNRNQKNYLYPITGSLKLAELIGAFLNLNQSGNLVGLDEPGKDLIPTISDTIGFTTKTHCGRDAQYRTRADNKSIFADQGESGERE